MSVTGPQTRELHNSGVENRSAIGRLPSTWLNETACMFSGGMPRREQASSRGTEASVSVATSGGRWPTPGIGVLTAAATSPVDPISLVPTRLSASTSNTPDFGNGIVVE